VVIAPRGLAETSRLLIERAHEELVGGNIGDPRLGQIRPLVQDSGAARSRTSWVPRVSRRSISATKSSRRIGGRIRSRQRWT
jgi:hypothetical protein